ncbi:hypothetical protein ACP70R_007638 [Stipagrostis hirtigluma subsp. patula]
MMPADLEVLDMEGDEEDGVGGDEVDGADLVVRAALVPWTTKGKEGGCHGIQVP